MAEAINDESLKQPKLSVFFPSCHRLLNLRIHKQSCTVFDVSYVYKPSILQKNPYASLERTFQFSEEAFRFAAQLVTNAHTEKCSECQHPFFDAYRSFAVLSLMTTELPVCNRPSPLLEGMGRNQLAS